MMLKGNKSVKRCSKREEKVIKKSQVTKRIA